MILFQERRLGRYDGVVRVTVNLAQALVMEAKRRAAEKGVALDDLIEAGLRRALNDPHAHKPFRLRKASVGGKGPVPGMDWPRIREEIYRGRGA